MRKLLLVLVTLLAAPLFLAAQEADEWYLDKPIADIVFEGLETVSETELEGIVQPFIGKEFTDTLFWDLQSKLYALDYFDQIIPHAEPANEERTAVVIRFEVEERPVAADVEISGNRGVRKSEIFDVILMKEGDIVTRSKIELDESAILDLYREKGYPSASVEGEAVERNGRTVVVFTLEEGNQTRVRTVRFAGNEFASEGSLKRVLVTKEQGLFNSGVFQEGNLEQDIQKIVQYYRERGYIDAAVTEVGREVVEDDEDDRNYLTLTYYISEGEQYSFGGMEFEGNSIFPEEQLQQLVRTDPGDVLNMTKLEADFQRVADLYYEHGYIFNLISRDEKRDDTNNVISYDVTIVERSRAHIENIIIKGNDKTKESVIRREIPLEEGEIFSKGKIVEGLRNLMNLQYFSAVTPETPPGSVDQLMDLVINVEEGQTADIRFGVSFTGSTEFPVSAYVKWADRNFLGRGQTMSAEIVASPVRQTLNFDFTENWLFGYRWSGGVELGVTHAKQSGIPQDILLPRYYDEDDPVPDPYGKGYVFTSDTTYNSVNYEAGDYFPGSPSATDISQYDLVTDYEYFVNMQKNAIPQEYLMTYDLWEISFGLNTGYTFKPRFADIGIGTGIRFTPTFITYDEELYRPYRQEDRDNLDTWLFINKWWITTSLDNRDFIFNPTKGFFLSQYLGLTGGFLGGESHYIRTNTRAEAFFTLLDVPLSDTFDFKLVLALHSAWSLIFPQFGQDDPILKSSDLLYIDGMQVARGWYGTEQVGAKLGKALWDNWIELRMPVVPNLLWFDFFWDAAALWEERDMVFPMNRQDFYFSLGGGLRFTIPQLPIRLSLVKRYRYDPEEGLVWMEGPIFRNGPALDLVFSLGTGLY